MMGIIGSIEHEISILQEKMEIDRTREICGMNFTYGGLFDKEVVVVKNGIGKVNSAICTQLLADKFHVDSIVSTGLAGALSPELNVCDLVISKDAVQYDVDASIPGYSIGEIPGLKSSKFESDEHLLNSALDSFHKIKPDGNIKAHIGRIVSGDRFVADIKFNEYLYTAFKASCVDMEGAAIAHTACLNNIPYVLVRVISDKADGSAALDVTKFEKQAIELTSNLIEEMLLAV